MARIVLGIGTGHASTLGTHPSQVKKVAERDMRDPRIDYTALLQQAPARVADEITDEKMQQHYEECLAGVTELDRVFRSVNPDVIIVIGDDQHEQFLDDNLPMFAIFNGQDMPITHRRYAWSDPQRDWNCAFSSRITLHVRDLLEGARTRGGMGEYWRDLAILRSHFG